MSHAHPVSLNRVGIRTLIKNGHTRRDLAEHFYISRQWLTQYLDNGVEPRHPGITYYINFRTLKLLKLKQQ